MSDSERVRVRTVHGYAFRNIGADELAKIEAYLDDGDPAHLDGTSYRELRDLADQQINRPRKKGAR